MEYEGEARKALMRVGNDIADELFDETKTPNEAIDLMAYVLAKFATGVSAEDMTTEELIRCIATQAIGNLKRAQ